MQIKTESCLQNKLKSSLVRHAEWVATFSCGGLCECKLCRSRAESCLQNTLESDMPTESRHSAVADPVSASCAGPNLSEVALRLSQGSRQVTGSSYAQEGGACKGQSKEQAKALDHSQQ